MSARITIPIAKAHKVIAETVQRSLKAHGIELTQWQGVTGARALDAERVGQICSDIGRNATQALMVIDETPIEEIELEYEEGSQPRAARARGKK